MATLNNDVLTLADWAKRLDPMGKYGKIIEVLTQTNEIINDMAVLEGNLPTGHRVNIRTGLPDVYWKIINQGVKASKSTVAQITSQCGKLTGYSRVEKDLAEIGGGDHGAKMRLSEGSAFLQSLNNEMARAIFYGDESKDPEQFTGLSARYSKIAGVESGQNVIDGGGTGMNNCSIWHVEWGEDAACAHFPKGSKMGVSHNDLGLRVFKDDDDRISTEYVDEWKWSLGLFVKDWRKVVRIANINVDELQKQSNSAAKIVELLIKSHYRIPNPGMARTAIYMNRTCAQYLDIEQYKNVKGAGMTYKDVQGKRLYEFRGIPIRICDALLNSESRVV